MRAWWGWLASALNSAEPNLPDNYSFCLQSALRDTLYFNRGFALSGTPLNDFPKRTNASSSLQARRRAVPAKSLGLRAGAM
jgi:hypothetical protein